MSSVNKRHLHHFWRRLRRVSYIYFLLGFLLSGLIFVLACRNNNLTALQLRDQLLTNDRNGVQVEKSLNTLRSYIYSHMNASLDGGAGSIYPPIQLKGTYDRLVAKAQKQADDANAQASVDAQTSCNQQFPGAKTGYLLCLQNYQAAHTVAPQVVPDSLYKFDFVAPRWSPDLAGWSLVVATLFLLLFVVRVLLEWWLRYMMRQHE